MEPGTMEVARRDLRGVIIIPNPHHYVLSMGAVFSMLGGLYFWFEKITGVRYSEILGKIHFWSFFIGVNLTFFPMHFLGVAGMPRRIPDYPDAYFTFNKIASWGSYISAISSLFFFFVVFEAFSANRKIQRPIIINSDITASCEELKERDLKLDTHKQSENSETLSKKGSGETVQNRSR